MYLDPSGYLFFNKSENKIIKNIAYKTINNQRNVVSPIILIYRKAKKVTTAPEKRIIATVNLTGTLKYKRTANNIIKNIKIIIPCAVIHRVAT